MERADLELIARFLTGGDREALGALLARHRSACYGVALHVTRSAEDAEDACQEAAVRAIRGLEGFDPSGSFRAWLLRIACAAATDIARRRGARRRREAALGQPSAAPEPASARVEKAEIEAAVRAALARLEERYRLPVVLRYEQGLSYREASAVLGLPEPTVRTYVSRGLEKLRRRLELGGLALAPAAAAGLVKAAAAEAPASLGAALSGIAASAAMPSAQAAAGGAAAAAAASKGVLAMKLIAGLVLTGALAGAALVAGAALRLGSTGEAAKVPGKDYPYGEGVVYRREVAFGSFASGYQDGPGPEMESFDCGRTMAPSGNWYILDESVERVIRKYDAARKRVYTIAWGGPLGCQGGRAECARFAGGGYHNNMGISVDRDEKYLTIFDRSNQGTVWRLDLEKGTVEPAPGADALKGARVRGQGEDGCTYFAMSDGKLKRLLADGKTVEDTGVTLEGPVHIETFFGHLAVNVKLGRLYAATRDPYSPWGVIWYWDMKTGKAHGIAGPRKGQDAKDLVLGSGPADKVKFWCGGGPGFGPDRGARYLYYAGGDESTFSRIDLEKQYVHKLVKADPKDRSLWTFGEGRQGKEYRFLDPYNWAGCPSWGPDGEFYMTWALASKVDVYRPVSR